MAPLNRHGREIWFERWLWSYVPCHRKGVIYPVLIIFATVLSCVVAQRLDPALPLPFLLVGLALVTWVCERHSPSRR